MTELSDARIQQGRSVIRGYTGWAASSGLAPVPLMDIAGLMTTQVAMLRDLARLYGVPFDGQRARMVLSAVAGGLAPQGIVGLGGVSALKAVPVVGWLLGMAVMPALTVASTLAVGEWFLQHLAAGGTLADAAPAAKAPEAAPVPEPTPTPAPTSAPAAVRNRPRRQPRLIQVDKDADAG